DGPYFTVFLVNRMAIDQKNGEICPRPAEFSLRFFKSDSLLGMKYLNAPKTVPDSVQPMPEPRRAGVELLPTGMTERFYLERFMGEFGAKWNETKIIKDKSEGYDLAVSDLIFTDHKTGKTKITKNGRAPYLLYVAQAILEPRNLR
ncbi:MAG: PBECR2 nuclease fold domain-containing protein, partial [Sulfuricellaceae bacterium]